MRELIRRARRRCLLRAVVRLLGVQPLYRRAVVEPTPFPRPTDPAALARLLDTARRNVPYYRDHLPAIDLADPIAALAATSFRTPKSVLKENVRAVMDETYAPLDAIDYKSAPLATFRRLLRARGLVRANTSGTTGRPLEFYRGTDTLVHMFFGILEEMRVLGWRPGDAVLSAWQALGPRRSTPVQLALRALGFPLFTFTHIDEASCRAFFARLECEAPAVLFGFPSYYVEFARYRKATGCRLHSPPRFLLCGGEALPDDARALLEDAFEAPVYNSYGGNEFGFVACECRERRGLHVLDHAFVVSTDEHDELLLTTLDQPEMPLIRYETGDRAIVARERCACGITGTKILQIEGRTEEYVLDGEGDRVFSRYFREVLLETNRHFDNAIVRAQFRQDAGRRLRFAIEVIDGAPGAAMLASIRERLTDDLKLDVSGEIAARLVPDQGKLKFLVRDEQLADLSR